MNVQRIIFKARQVDPATGKYTEASRSFVPPIDRESFLEAVEKAKRIFDGRTGCQISFVRGEGVSAELDGASTAETVYSAYQALSGDLNHG